MLIRKARISTSGQSKNTEEMHKSLLSNALTTWFATWFVDYYSGLRIEYFNWSCSLLLKTVGLLLDISNLCL